jgi:hypothetical protein
VLHVGDGNLVALKPGEIRSIEISISIGRSG